MDSLAPIQACKANLAQLRLPHNALCQIGQLKPLAAVSQPFPFTWGRGIWDGSGNCQLSGLAHVDLSGNGAAGGAGYRAHVLRLCPRLLSLDNAPIVAGRLGHETAGWTGMGG